MNDKEKLLKMIEHYNPANPNCFEEILFMYLDFYGNDFPASRLSSLIKNLNEYLYANIKDLETTKSIAYERAYYLKTYLSGDMWTTEEAARANLEPQIRNAQAIIDACKI